MHISKRRLPSSPAEKHIDEIKNPSTREVEKMFEVGAVIFDITESTEKERRNSPITSFHEWYCFGRRLFGLAGIGVPGTKLFH
jgi:hypothetical protein